MRSFVACLPIGHIGRLAMKNPVRVSVLSAAALLGAASNCCLGQTSTWNTASGVWNVAGNWLPAVVPPAGNGVRIVNSDATSRTVTFNFNYTSPLDDIISNQTGTGTNTLLMGTNQLLAGSITLGDTGRAAMVQTGGIVGIT